MPLTDVRTCNWNFPDHMCKIETLFDVEQVWCAREQLGPWFREPDAYCVLWTN